MQHPHDILLVIGTRPELIKVAPVVIKLKDNKNYNFKVVNTGQHKELLNKYWKAFNFEPDYNLDIITKGQDLSNLTIKAIGRFNDLINQLIEKNEKPSVILAQGDTTTVMATSMVAFYHGIKFFHLEAGLRSFDLQQPFPEEFNRKVASIVATHHLAPTETAKKNLLNEKIDSEKISIVGNTVIDALNIIQNSGDFKNLVFEDDSINLKIKKYNQVVLITCHRRENQNQNLQNLIYAINKLATENQHLLFIWPVHANPNIKNYVLNSNLANLENVILSEALEYMEILKIMQNCKIILTDSGGIQEEAPSFKVPVLVLREKTERPEAVELGFSKLVGCDIDLIIDNFYNFNPDFSNMTQSPYGDGKSAEKIVSLILQDLS